MIEEVSEIGKSLNVDRFYKLMSIAGIIFIGIGAFSNNSSLVKVGLLTFIYGIFLWMIGEGFHITTSITLPPNSKWSPLHFVIIHISIMLISLISYIFLIFYIQKA